MLLLFSRENRPTLTARERRCVERGMRFGLGWSGAFPLKHIECAKAARRVEVRGNVFTPDPPRPHKRYISNVQLKVFADHRRCDGPRVRVQQSAQVNTRV